MTRNPQVSVIMPFYNVHAFVAESVKSVLAQTHDNYEIIIVNDGSNPPSPQEVLKDAGVDASKIRFIDHEKNRGLAETRNTAFHASKGEFVLPLDTDDLISPSFLQEATEVLENNSNIDAVYTQVHVFGEMDFCWTPVAEIIGLMVGIPLPSTILFRRKVFEAVGGYRSKLTHSPDTDFWVMALSKGFHLSRIEKPLYHYREHKHSLSEVGKYTEVADLARANPELYHENLIEVLTALERKHFKTKAEYAQLEDGFKQLDAGYKDLLARYDEVVRRLRARSVRHQLKRIMPFLSKSPGR